ncbi:porin [Aquabacterium sp.]|jgi:predicted porin|uniref:porin n=1 Tax=Aquabacterium sp. TaxID=1872578 RepID=UPI002488EEBA|nr:porin [Aquabacterium sp.]MDI1350878.1 porin [Aquabacterium sp.]
MNATASTKTLVCRAALGAIALVAASAAQAQSTVQSAATSSVTLYGIIDMFVQYGKGDGTQLAVQSGGVSGSRLGFKGSEDLGGGLKAQFQLESGILTDTGAQANASSFFTRQSWVGLSSSTWGSLSAGRQTIPQYDILDAFDTFGTGVGSSASSSIVSTTSRANNSVKYSSPNLGGFSGVALVGMGETAPTATNSGDNANVYALGGTYTGGPFSAGLALNMFKRGTNAQVDARYVLATASYDFGVAKLSGAVQKVRNLSGTDSVDRTEAMLGVNVPVTERNTVSAAVGQVTTSHQSSLNARQWTLGATHVMSKRTSFYGVLSHIGNGAATSYTTTAANGLGPITSAGKDVSSLQVGVRHAF